MKPGATIASWLAARRSRRSLRACDEVGDGAVVEGSPTILNMGRMRIGRRFHLSSVAAPSHLLSGDEGTLEIGDDVSIGHGAAVAAMGRVTIGSAARIAPFVIVMDSDFHVAGDRSSEARPEPITIGARVRIGSHVTVLRGSEIGDGAIVAAGSVVAGKIREGARVSGVPAREAIAQEGASGDLAAPSVLNVIRRSLGLSHTPPLEHGPTQIPQWDSLGALRLLLALEEAFGVALSEDEVLRVSTVADLTRVVDRAVSRLAAKASGDGGARGELAAPLEQEESSQRSETGG